MLINLIYLLGAGYDSTVWHVFITLNGLTALTTSLQILGLELAAMNGVLVLTLLTVAYICLVLSSLVIDLV